MAAEILCRRWTVVLLRELCAGSTRVEELRMGLGQMPSDLLARRLDELERAGILEVSPDGAAYRLTRAGEDLKPVIAAIGIWGQRWVDAQSSLENLDPALLMWDMRREIDVAAMPRPAAVISFHYPEQPEDRRFWWLVAGSAGVRLERSDPGLDIDLRLVTSLYSMTAIWMGVTSIDEERRARRLDLIGDSDLAGTIDAWMRLSPFAGEKKPAED